MESLRLTSQSLTKNMNSTGPRTEPWGEPVVTYVKSDAPPLINHHCLLSVSHPVCAFVYFTRKTELFDFVTLGVEHYETPLENPDKQCPRRSF